jgi:tetraacyldisaccharide 4'-kinase
MLHLLYGRLARARRAWYEARPAARRALRQPVVSVGNLSMGGTGKTPLVAALAQWLVANGERPAILSRGYRRRARGAGVTTVSDGLRILADVHHAGDEPLMLARAVPDACVVVGADRHAAGVHAEQALGATVHLLDDGFQHVRLARDLDIVLTSAGALAEDHVVPKGRLREPLEVLRRASVLVVIGASEEEAAAEGAAYQVPQTFAAARRLSAPVALAGGGVPPAGARVVALAGIGQPAQFVDGVRAAGWQVADACLFADHHWFTAADLEGVARRVADTGAWGVLTTDKDAVRLEGLMPLRFAAARVPLALEVPRWEALTALVGAALTRRRDAGRGAHARPGGPA